MIILCKKCGRVEGYMQKETVHRWLYFDENGEPDGSSEDVEDRCGRPRCVKCGRIVEIYMEVEDADSN